MSTQEVGQLIDSVNDLTQTVANKNKEIDDRMNAAENDFEQWKATTSYVQAYQVSEAEGSKESDKNTGKYHVVRLYTVRDSIAAQHPWIHMGFTGINQVGAGHFCSLAQSHSSYTGQGAMWVKRGSCDVKFYIDRTNQNNAPVYMAIKNESWNNANVRLNIASYMALDVLSLGALDLATWLGDNPSIVEIDTIDITTQPAQGA
ncbi:TPA: hypothetical protein JG860_004366 [Vibrio parahaemolyticus]|nr:hypothetical protein [Vibrio parahaemolyticus]